MSDDETVAVALEAWESSLHFVAVERLPLVSNPVWKVVSDSDRTFALKQLPEVPPGVGLVDEFRVLCHLAGGGVPLPLPVVTDEATLAVQVDDRQFTLLPWIDSDSDNHGCDRMQL